MRKREIKRFGGSLAINIVQADLDDLQLKEGDFVDIDEIVKVKKTS